MHAARYPSPATATTADAGCTGTPGGGTGGTSYPVTTGDGASVAVACPGRGAPLASFALGEDADNVEGGLIGDHPTAGCAPRFPTAIQAAEVAKGAPRGVA
jgi:hypothetical protein